MKHILIVNSDEKTTDEICACLSAYQTCLAATGRAALEMVRLNKPDLILLDIDMPDLDGFSILDQLHLHSRFQYIPVILFSEDVSPEFQLKALKSGAVDFIYKPVDLEILHHKVELHLKFGEYKVSLERSVNEMEDNIGLCFAELIECKDYNFSGHIIRTERYAEFLAIALYNARVFSAELNLKFIENLRKAIPFHDIGKIGISDTILLKQGPLDDGERKIVRTHTTIGAKILNDIHDLLPGRDYFKAASIIARGHHERFDGKGYPDGFSGDNIPLYCRIAAVANVYDACVNERIYRSPMSHEDACNEIKKGSGSEFDPRVADVFLQNSKKFARLGEELKSFANHLAKPPFQQQVQQIIPELQEFYL